MIILQVLSIILVLCPCGYSYFGRLEKIRNFRGVRLACPIRAIERSNLKLVDGDIVEYVHISDFGPVKVASIEGNKLYPLCIRSDDSEKEDMITLCYDETAQYLNIDSVNITHVYESVHYSQRIVEDRISNPHGEHAEDVWIIERSSFRASIN